MTDPDPNRCRAVHPTIPEAICSRVIGHAGQHYLGVQWSAPSTDEIDKLREKLRLAEAE